MHRIKWKVSSKLPYVANSEMIWSKTCESPYQALPWTSVPVLVDTKVVKKLWDGREGLRAEGRGSEGRLRACKDFGLLPFHVFWLHERTNKPACFPVIWVWNVFDNMLWFSFSVFTSTHDFTSTFVRIIQSLPTSRGILAFSRSTPRWGDSVGSEAGHPNAPGRATEGATPCRSSTSTRPRWEKNPPKF